jgi:hypothetical protein
MSAAAAHAARQKNKAKKEAAAAKDNSPSKWSFRSKKVEDEPSGVIVTDGDEDVEYSRCFPTLEVERPRTDGFFLNKLRYYQPEDKYIYEHVYVQIFVAVLIMGNFGVNIAEAQIGTNGYAKEAESGRGSYKDKGGYKETTYDGTDIYFKRGEDSHLSSTMRVFVGFDLCGNQPVRRVHRRFFTKSFLGDDAAVLAPSSGEEPAPPRHRAGVASMA